METAKNPKPKPKRIRKRLPGLYVWQMVIASAPQIVEATKHNPYRKKREDTTVVQWELVLVCGHNVVYPGWRFQNNRKKIPVQKVRCMKCTKAREDGGQRYKVSQEVKQWLTEIKY